MSSFSGFVSNAPPCHSNVNDGIFQCCFSDACRYVYVMEIERAQKGMDKNPKVKHACENMNEDELEIMIKNVFTTHKVIQ